MAEAANACGGPDATRRSSTTKQPVRIAPGVVAPCIEMVVEVNYLTWTEDGLLRQVVYLGEREDKPAAEVRRGLRAV